MSDIKTLDNTIGRTELVTIIDALKNMAEEHRDKARKYIGTPYSATNVKKAEKLDNLANDLMEIEDI